MDVLKRTDQSETIVGACDLDMLGEITYDRGDRINANDYFRTLTIDAKMFGPTTLTYSTYFF
ncbi:MAG: hypothetical protein ABI999_11780 [Acidobacteriota bacterium]